VRTDAAGSAVLHSKFDVSEQGVAAIRGAIRAEPGRMAGKLWRRDRPITKATPDSQTDLIRATLFEGGREEYRA
jgi:hypothetical protein